MRRYIDIISENAVNPNAELLSYMQGGGLADELRLIGSVAPGSWLIHFSQDADVISQHGFTRGTKLMHLSGVTYGSLQPEAGFNFAFDTSDEYSLRTLSEYGFGGYGTISKAVMFRSAGVACHHLSDQFDQVIFWGPGAEGPFVVLVRDDEEDDREPHECAWRVDGLFFHNLWDAMSYVESKA